MQESRLAVRQSLNGTQTKFPASFLKLKTLEITASEKAGIRNSKRQILSAIQPTFIER